MGVRVVVQFCERALELGPEEVPLGREEAAACKYGLLVVFEVLEALG